MEKFKISSDVDVTNLINLMVEDFATNSFWRKRQMFINLSHKLVSINRIFILQFLLTFAYNFFIIVN